MLALERAVGASRVCAIECIAGGGTHLGLCGLGTQRRRIRSVGGALWTWDRKLRETPKKGEVGGRVRHKQGSLGSAGEGHMALGAGGHDVGEKPRCARRCT